MALLSHSLPISAPCCLKGKRDAEEAEAVTGARRRQQYCRRLAYRASGLVQYPLRDVPERGKLAFPVHFSHPKRSDLQRPISASSRPQLTTFNPATDASSKTPCATARARHFCRPSRSNFCLLANVRSVAPSPIPIVWQQNWALPEDNQTEAPILSCIAPASSQAVSDGAALI